MGLKGDICCQKDFFIHKNIYYLIDNSVVLISQFGFYLNIILTKLFQQYLKLHRILLFDYIPATYRIIATPNIMYCFDK